GWPVWGEAIILLALYYFSRSLTGPAIMFAAARRADHRPAPRARQFAAAADSLGSRFGHDLLVSLLQLVVYGSIVGLVVIGGVSWPVPDLAQLSVLFVGFLILCFLAVGLSLAQGLGRVALTLGRPSPWRAFVIGWNFFRRHLELAGLHILSLLLELLLVAPIIALIVTALIYLPAGWKISVPMAAVVLVVLGGAMIGAGTAVWWAELYRALVRRYRPGEVAKLLNGRNVVEPGVRNKSLVWILGTLLVTIAIIWPWLPL